jgi:hypothetical protein
LLLKSVGGVVDDACPALYPTYVSFLHAQVTPERVRAPSHFCPYPFISQDVCVHVQIMNMRACGSGRRTCRNLIHAHMDYTPCHGNLVPVVVPPPLYMTEQPRPHLDKVRCRQRL